MAHILILRFSALGDVAMTVPVIHALARQYPNDTITFATRKGWQPLFGELPGNVHIVGIDLAKYKGICGLERLYKELRQTASPHLVADLHDVLRTKYLRLRFSMQGCRVAHIDKGRREKRQLTLGSHRLLRPLKHSVSRYAEVLQSLGRTISASPVTLFSNRPQEIPDYLTRIVGTKSPSVRWIGVAPFARHRGKIYPQEQMSEVLRLLCNKADGRRIFLFGGGEQERTICEEWANRFPAVTSLIGQATFSDELLLISKLDIMLSMDSANMHIAANCGTPVFSVWGATHPYAGFSPWGQPAEQQIGLDGLTCRPCSIYGNKPCPRGDYACLTQLPAKMIAERIEHYLTTHPVRQ